MRLLKPLAVFVVAILTSHTNSNADETAPLKATTQMSPTSSPMTTVPYCDVNGYDQYRQSPDQGSPGSPAHGFRHFPSPMHAFTSWYRPRAATLTRHQRCAEDDFRPRGYGHLFARPCDPFRMEYTPHIITDDRSTYGPAYLLRQCDQRCENCDH
ncbi:MAG: hypothetical protein RIK87_15685 [Fuerstiella sp.]